MSAAVMLTVPSPTEASSLGEQCRQGNLSSCQTLCNRGFDKACNRLRMGARRNRPLMVSFGDKTVEAMQARGLVPTGLKPVYPERATCTRIASYFGARTRHDGSRRVPFANFGYHGGIDLSLSSGTPVMAIASGTVIHKRQGGLLIGVEVFLRHAPQDTGLKVWTFSKYKHFLRMPKLAVGQRLAMGETVGLSGRTGTVGGHFGQRGYPHLHLSTYMSASGVYSAKNGQVMIDGARHVDPLAFYFRRELDSHRVRALPKDQRKVVIPYKTADGAVVPEQSPTIWPVACARR